MNKEMWTEGNNNETWTKKCGLKKIGWNMNNDVDNVTFNDFTSGSKILSFSFAFCFVFFCFFFWLKHNSICLFIKEFNLFYIWLTIQHSSKYLFGFSTIRPDFVLTGGAVIFEGISVFVCTKVFCDVFSLGSVILS